MNDDLPGWKRKRLRSYRKFLHGWDEQAIRNELESDLLLRTNRGLGVRRGTFTEWELYKRRVPSVEPLDDYAEETVVMLQPIDDLCHVAWREIEDGAARLGVDAATTYYLSLIHAGCGFAEIERIVRGTAHQAERHTISRRVRHAARAIASRYPYFGLWEIIARACRVSQAEARYMCKKAPV